MAFAPTSPITGAAVTGLTTPTMTFVEDQAPNGNARKFVVTSLGGTQTGCEAHSNASPYFLLVTRPANVKTLPRINPGTGQYVSIPKNVVRVQLVKGATIGSTVPQEDTILFDGYFKTPAGIDLAANDTEELKTALSFWGGFFFSNASGLYDLITTNMLK